MVCGAGVRSSQVGGAVVGGEGGRLDHGTYQPAGGGGVGRRGDEIYEYLRILYNRFLLCGREKDSKLTCMVPTCK